MRSLLLQAVKTTYGGQAVVEGVMMRSPHWWAVAVRKPDGEIAVHSQPFRSILLRRKFYRLPIVRGVIALGEATTIGFKAIRFSSAQAIAEPEADKTSKIIIEEEAAQAGSAIGAGAVVLPKEDKDLPGWLLAVMILISFGFSILLFKLTPAFLASLAVSTGKTLPFVILEASIKVSIFITYTWLIGLGAAGKSIYQYHAGEHKAINALEHGKSLDPKTVNAESRIHVRCGTAFLLWVFMVALIIFGILGYLIGPLSLPEVLVSRVLLLPLIAGISFEIIRFAGNHADNVFLRSILAPGLWLQRLTTKECDDAHCEVAIAALERVRELENNAHEDKEPEAEVLA